MTDADAARDLRDILHQMLSLNIAKPGEWELMRHGIECAVMSWHRRHPAPATEEGKVWPCEHIVEASEATTPEQWVKLPLDCGGWHYQTAPGEGWLIPKTWSICPVAGCGARRPGEEKPCQHPTDMPPGYPGWFMCGKCGKPKPPSWWGVEKPAAQEEKPKQEVAGEDEVERLSNEIAELLYKKHPLTMDCYAVARWVLSRDRKAKEGK